MLFKKRSENSDKYPAAQSGSYITFRRRRFSKHSKIIAGVFIFAVLVVPAVLLAKSLYAYKSVVQPHAGVSSQVLTKNDNEFDSKTEAAGRVNILLLGVGDAGHAGSTLADTMIVASVDPQTKDVAMLSLPRDLYVPIPGNSKNKINAAHAFGELQKSGEGPNLAKEVVGNVLDVPIHNYVRVDFTGFKRAIEVLGGVSIDVAKPLSDSEYPCEKDERRACGFSIRAGSQSMNGTTALKYARCRKGNCGNDFGRAARQQEVLLAMREKALQLSTLTNPAKLAGMIDTIGSHVRTDLSTDELARLAEILKDIKPDSVRSKVVDGEEEKLVQTANMAGASVVVPVDGDGKFDRLRDFAHSLFYDRHIVEENISVTIVNASKKANLAAAIAERLKGYRYTIVEVKNTQAQEQSELLDGTGGKAKYTRRYLEARFGLTAKEDVSRGSGITLVIGNDNNTKVGER